MYIAQGLAVLYRCQDTAVEGHGGIEAIVLAARDGDEQVLAQAQGGLLQGSLPYPRLGQGIAGLVELVGLEEAEAVVQQRLAGDGTGLFAAGTEYHGDQAHALALGGGHQAVAGRVRMAGLETVDGGVAPQQTIAVVLGDAIEGELPLRVPVIVLGEFLDQVAGQNGDVPGRGVVLLMGPAITVDEVRSRHPQFPGIAIHQAGEGVLAAGYVLGQGHAGIVARLHDQALQQGLHAHLRAYLDEHARALGAPGLLAHPDHVIQGQLTALELLEHGIGGHDLGDTGRLHTFVDFVFRQYLAAVEILQQVGLRANGRGLGHRQGSGRGLAGQQQAGEKRQTDAEKESFCHGLGIWVLPWGNQRQLSVAAPRFAN